MSHRTEPVFAVNDQTRVLATDLDGTFIPLDGDLHALASLGKIRDFFANQRKRTLERFKQPIDVKQQIGDQSVSAALLYVTGRHFESVVDAIEVFDLPMPHWVLCDVGTCIYRHDGERLVREQDYEAELDEVVALHRLDRDDVERHREAIGQLPRFRAQEAFKQGRHKLSYYVPANALDACVDAVESYIAKHKINYGIVSSVDPFNDDGLIDVLPRGVSKAFALDWWRRRHSVDQNQIVFCGDSGNDLAALVAGYNSVIVGNADRTLADQVAQIHRQKGWVGRLFLANSTSTTAVLEGLRWYGVISSDTEEHSSGHSTRWGASLVGPRDTRFRCYAPGHSTLSVSIVDRKSRVKQMDSLGEGWFETTLDNVPAGTLYQYILHDQKRFPDPASRYQPDGVHGPSMVVDRSFAWKHDGASRPSRRQDLVLYELHVATFTSDGTFASAISRLDELVDLGITAIELMPIAACPGRWNWGYDATHWFAPMASLGSPDDVRRFVDECHGRGLSVLLDVVYNHFGPEGNYLPQFGDYLSTRHPTAWGAGPNFDNPTIRRFVIDNALMWIDEYHLDGLRVDAIHCMGDDSPEHITRQMGREVSDWAATQDRKIWLIAETNVYDAQMTVAIKEGGCGFDAQWCDDYLHAVFANLRPGEQLTTRVYRPHVDLAQTLSRGFVFSGDVRGYRGRDDDESPEVDRWSQIICIQNHDFIGNHPLGRRLHQLTSVSTQAAAAALTLMMPCVPMIFMGEEFACDRPFQFFVDFGDEELRDAVVEGRKRDYPQHDWSGGVLPIDPAAMTQSKVGPASDGDQGLRELYQKLLRLRRDMIEREVLSAERMTLQIDERASLYRLDYQYGPQRLSIVARLAPLVANAENAMEHIESDVLRDLPSTLLLETPSCGAAAVDQWAGQQTKIYGEFEV